MALSLVGCGIPAYAEPARAVAAKAWEGLVAVVRAAVGTAVGAGATVEEAVGMARAALGSAVGVKWESGLEVVARVAVAAQGVVAMGEASSEREAVARWEREEVVMVAGFPAGRAGQAVQRVGYGSQEYGDPAKVVEAKVEGGPGGVPLGGAG